MTVQTRPTPPDHDRPVVVDVNNRPVTLPDNRLTGLQVKQAAVAAGLPVDLGFQLIQEHPNGRDAVVGDDDEVKANTNSRFVMIAPDDNS